MPFGKLLSVRFFWLFFLLMICSGAAEQAVSQWASLFVETGLGVSKTMGDLFGPCAFACLMGLSRLIYGKLGNRLPLHIGMLGTSALCVSAYLLIALAPWPIVSLLGCGLCGFSVGILWPGTFSLASEQIPTGGTAMFGLLALAGDVGCAGGPGLAGAVAGLAGDNMRTGFLVATVFPFILLLSLLGLQQKKRFDYKNI